MGSKIKIGLTCVFLVNCVINIGHYVVTSSLSLSYHISSHSDIIRHSRTHLIRLLTRRSCISSVVICVSVFLPVLVPLSL